jgi:thiamine-phosphate pyrophosphorylase
MTSALRLSTFRPPRLYVICDVDVCARAGWTLVDFAAACLDGGATCLQVRAKQTSARVLYEAAAAIVARARPAGAMVIVNDRADVARVAGAGGVHVGQEDLTPSDVRVVTGAESVVGLSTHTMEQLDRALTEPIDYLAVGPVFGTDTKATGYAAVGLEHVRRAVQRVAANERTLPVVAIGGITLDRAPGVIASGARSVAVISDLLATGDPTSRVVEFLAALR